MLSKHHLLKTVVISVYQLLCMLLHNQSSKAQWLILLLFLLVLHCFAVNILSMFKPKLKIITVKYGSSFYTSPACWQFFWSRMASISIVCLCSTWFLILWQASPSLFTQGPGKVPKESKSLELALHNFCHIHWPKHITRPAQIQRLGERVHSLMDRVVKLHAKEVESMPIFAI